ncbi:hypothetical protein JHK85_011554 [Glycine max]|nr:hypothetical protein JHK85_011554 [Glycine max]
MASSLGDNFNLLSPQQQELVKMLLDNGQEHLFRDWPAPGVDDDHKNAFFDQLTRLDSSYPGGLEAYITNAKRLLADSKAGRNPFDGFTPSVPTGETLAFGDENYIKFEEAGVLEARKAAFVLVAGGLGERLGYSGIKLALPAETTTRTCFVQNYIESILALQEASSQGESQTQIPLVIMTSDDTHGRTLELLESNSYFGMQPTQVTLLKQEKVACLEDNDARLALEPQNKYKIQYSLPSNLRMQAIPSALGVSAAKQYHVNSLAVPRKAKEAIGGITRLTHSDGRSMVINVEYNQLDPLLRASGYPDGDVNCETGYSPFPGNINQVMETWLAYAPVKNNAEDAAKVPKGNPYHSATSGEMAIYRANSIILRKAGVQVADPVVQVFNGQEVEVWPRITWKPKWGLTFNRIKSKVSGNCSISLRSTLAIKGPNIFIENLSVDGALIIDAVDDAEVNVSGSVQNNGWVLETVDNKDASEPEVLRIRGFKFNKIEQLETKYSEPGKFHLKA